MKNKVIFSIILVVFSISCSEKEVTSYEHKWFDFFKLEESNFETSNKELDLEIIHENGERFKNQLLQFEEFFSYSADSLFLVDLDSWSLKIEADDDGDSAELGTYQVKVIDCKNWTVKALFMNNSADVFQDAIWINNDEVWILGLSNDVEFYPAIWKVNLKEKKYVKHTSRNKIEGNSWDYSNQKTAKFRSI